jgi:hypothetical protein
MGYMHINNLYKDQRILLFRECYALEKIHGTSAHLSWNQGTLTFSPGGESQSRFVKAVDHVGLIPAFEKMGHPSVTVYGEAYGGSQQKQAWRYGSSLKFVAFDVKVGDVWLAVPQAVQLVTEQLTLEFVHFVKVATDLAALDAERDAPSEQARRNGIEGSKPREGVVLRPLIEVRFNDDERVIAKHKRAEERETVTPREVVDPEKMKILSDAEAIAFEWVTPTRLQHVLDKIGDVDMRRMRDVISAMTDDVLREGAGEIVDSREARAAIGKKTAQIFKSYLEAALRT